LHDNLLLEVGKDVGGERAHLLHLAFLEFHAVERVAELMGISARNHEVVEGGPQHRKSEDGVVELDGADLLH
jgi:hypothetical protein